jgi:hypothetical protein
VEVFEERYPFRTLNYGLAPDSGGAGTHRGGLATTRTLEVIADEITLSCLFDRAKIPAWGMEGGNDGAKSELLIQRAGTEGFVDFTRAFGTVSPTKFTNVRLQRGDLVRYVTPGGGGWGDPLLRDAEAVVSDVANGWLSLESAANDYGVIVTLDGPGLATLDADATGAKRAELRATRPLLAASEAPVPPAQADPTRPIPPHSPGRWVEIVRAWHDASLTQCDLCGRLIPRQGWQVESVGRHLMFCNDACEERYWTFWYPRYGGRAAD